MRSSLSPLAAAVLLLAACSPSSPPSEPKAAAATAAINAPAGQYVLDPNHSSLSFSVSHLGLSNYVIRFARFDVALTLDPANPSASSVTVTVDPNSVRTLFSGDYKAGHADSPYATWDEDLAQSPKFLNAAQHPTITFKSTKVERAGDKLRVTGDLTLLGQTHPVTLEAAVVGSLAAHPFTKRGALGLSATGTFKRSQFGMNHLLQPPLVGDEVTVEFEGEFQQAAPAA